MLHPEAAPVPRREARREGDRHGRGQTIVMAVIVTEGMATPLGLRPGLGNLEVPFPPACDQRFSFIFL